MKALPSIDDLPDPPDMDGEGRRWAPWAQVNERLSAGQPTPEQRQYDRDWWQSVGTRIGQRLARGARLFAFGNGGSAAQCEHFVAELIGRFEIEGRRPVAAHALTSPAAVITAIANDYGVEEIFRRQLAGMWRPGDIALALTTSGTSPNVVTALRYVYFRHLNDRGAGDEHASIIVAMIGGQAPLSGEHAAASYCTERYVPNVTKSTPALAQDEHHAALHALARAIDAAVDGYDCE